MTALNLLFYIMMVAIIYSVIMAYQRHMHFNQAAQAEIASLLTSASTEQEAVTDQLVSMRMNSLFFDIDIEDDNSVQSYQMNRSVSFLKSLEENTEEGLNLIGNGQPRTYTQDQGKLLSDYRREQSIRSA